MKKSEFDKQINDVNLELDKFHDFLRKSQITPPQPSTPQFQLPMRSPIYRVSPPSKQISSPRPQNYLSPQRNDIRQRTPSSNSKTSNSTTDDEIDAIIRCEREKSGTISPFKKYQFKKNTSFNSPIQDDNTVTQLSDDKIHLNANSEEIPTNSPTGIYLSQTDPKEMRRIIKAVHLIDKVNQKKKNTKYEDYSNSGVQLSISKSFAVPYSGSYEEGIVVKIEDDEEIDSDLEEFNHIRPPTPDRLSNDEDNQLFEINNIQEGELTKVYLPSSDEELYSSSFTESNSIDVNSHNEIKPS